MAFEITTDKDFFNSQEKSIQNLLKDISPIEEKTLFYLKEHTPEGKIEKDLCQMMNEMIKQKEITSSEKFLVKSYYCLHHQKNKGYNFGNYEKLSELTQTPIEEITSQINNIVENIKKYNGNLLKKYSSDFKNDIWKFEGKICNGEKLVKDNISVNKFKYEHHTVMMRTFYEHS